MKMNIIEHDYVARHIWRIENEWKDSRNFRIDSMLRIASHANLFDIAGQHFRELFITEAEEAIVKAFIQQFKSSPEGLAAIQGYVREVRQ